MTGTWTIVGPGLALLVVAGLAIVLRWAFGRGGSVVTRPGRPGAAGDYGLLVPVASPGTQAAGEVLLSRLARAGIKATLVDTTEGPRLMVFVADENAARRALSTSS